MIFVISALYFGTSHIKSDQKYDPGLIALMLKLKVTCIFK